MTREKRSSDERAWYTYPPNILTLFRFVLIVPVAILFMVEHRIASLILYLAATLTDFIDGRVARKYNMISTWGKAMDPLADKLLLLTIITCMFLKGDLPLPIIILVFGKEVIMILGGLLLYGRRKMVVPSNIVGKIGTVLFSVAVALVFLKEYTAHVHEYFMWAAAVFSIFSMLQYGVLLLRKPKDKENA